MMVKVAIPVTDKSGLSLYENFVKAPFFSLFDIVEGKAEAWRVRPNNSEELGGKGHPADHVLHLGVEVVISMEMGEESVDKFNEAGVLVLKTESTFIENALADYIDNKLQELT